jgi:hypothetical protein
MSRHETRFTADHEVPASATGAALRGELPPAAAPTHALSGAALARRRIRRRALGDAALLGLAVAAAPLLGDGPMQALLATVAAGGAAIIVYVARRSRDFEAFSRTARAREAQFRARGIPLAAWHGGEPLEAWTARAPHASEARS